VRVGVTVGFGVAVAAGRRVADGAGEGLAVALGVSVGGAARVSTGAVAGKTFPGGVQAARRKNNRSKFAIFRRIMADCNLPGGIQAWSKSAFVWLKFGEKF
jgi:hypothetical protein